MTAPVQDKGREALERLKADATTDRAPVNECTNGLEVVVGGQAWCPHSLIHSFLARIDADDSLTEGDGRPEMYLCDAVSNLHQLLAEVDCWRGRASRLIEALEEAVNCNCGAGPLFPQHAMWCRTGSAASILSKLSEVR